MKKCPYCAEEIQDAAIVCRHCGRDLLPNAPNAQIPRPKRKANPVTWATLMILGLLLLGWCVVRVPAPTSPGSATARTEASPHLALLSSSASSAYGYHKVAGEVRNVSTESLRNVEAVVTWRDGSGRFITSDTALIEYNPLLAGQTSPFEVATRSNPEMQSYTVEFKLLMGGTLRVREESTQQRSDGAINTPRFHQLARSGRTVAVRITTTELRDDSALWRIARYYQRDFVQATGDGSVTVMFWTDHRYAPTSLPPTSEQLAHRKAVITIDRKADQDRLERAK
jgi:hypothetical protein